MDKRQESKFPECDRRYENSHMGFHNSRTGETSYEPYKNFDAIESVRAETARKMELMKEAFAQMIKDLLFKLADQEKLIKEQQEQINTIDHDVSSISANIDFEH